MPRARKRNPVIEEARRLFAERRVNEEPDIDVDAMRRARSAGATEEEVAQVVEEMIAARRRRLDAR
jgi:hypothetical protein